MTNRYAGDGSPLEFSERPSLLEALLRHLPIAVLIPIVFFGLGLAYNKFAPEEYEATAEIIVQDPRADTLVNVASPEGRSNMSSERNLADQVQIVESAEVAEVASDLLDDEVSPRSILNNRTVTGSATSNLIEVEFRAENPELAKEGADALVAAYLDVRQRQIQETARVALERVDALQASLDQELEQIQSRIDQAVASDDSVRELNAQIDEALEKLNELRRERETAPPGSEERALINGQIEELISDFAGWEIILTVERQNSELAQLLAQQEAAIAERAALTGRRNSIAVDAELAAGGVTLVSPAQVPTEPAGLSPRIVLAALVLLGLGIAAGAAYYLSLRRRVVTDRAVPELVLEAPLLAVVPEFDPDGSLTELPVSAASHSAAAEAFRFAAAAIDIRASAIGARSVVVSSVDEGGATSITVANTAIAAAYAGNRVAVVDADFGRQELSQLFSLEFQVGMTDVVDGTIRTEHALQTAPVGNHRAISVLQRGKLPVDASNFFHKDATKLVFRYLVESFDLILIDSPSLTRVAYASTLARLADSAVLVVEHGTSIEALREAADRLDLVGTPVLGYVYSKAPIRASDKYQEPVTTQETESQLEEEEEQEVTSSATSPWFR